MKEIVRHIHCLLSEEGRAPLPGIGEITAYYEPAGVDLNTHRFRPPSQRLQFIERPGAPDTLSNYISEVSGKEKKRAVAEVKAYTASIRTALGKGEEFAMEGIGVFVADKTGKISFSADPDFFTKGEGIGLESFTLKPVPKASPPPEDTPPVPLVETSPPTARPSFAWIAWVMLFFLLVGSAAWYVYTNYDLPRILIGQYLPIASPVILDTVADNSTDTTALVLEPDTASSDTLIVSDTLKVSSDIPVEKTPEQSTQNVNPANAKYFIVAGAFRTEKGVQQTISRLKQRGYPAMVLDTMSSGLVIVCYGGYVSQEEAQQVLRKVVAEGDNEAWIRKVAN